MLSIVETSSVVHPVHRRSNLPWIGAQIAGAFLLAWVALANGFPLVFSDSGGYLRVGTEFHYLLDRPVTYGLMIAPLGRLSGLWTIVVLQALFASWLIGQVLIKVTLQRSAAMLIIVLAVLAVTSSLPWFVGQIMPDLATSLMILTLFLILFAPEPGWRAWLMATLLTGLIALHLSHIPIAAALIGMAGIYLLWRDGGRSALHSILPAISALLVAVLGLCAANLIAVDSFRPSLQSEKFLVAKTLDSRLGQPVLDRLCATETWQLCQAREFVEDPRRALPGQDYLWAADSPRQALEDSSPASFRSEEKAFAGRVLREDPIGTLRVAWLGLRDQLARARAADGMTSYSPGMEVVKQIHQHFPQQAAAFDTTRQQRGILQRLAVAPDGAIALLVVLIAPVILWFAIKRDDQQMISLTIFLLGAVIINAAVCGILSGPADRYQSRVIWLLILLGLIAARKALPGWRIAHLRSSLHPGSSASR